MFVGDATFETKYVCPARNASHNYPVKPVETNLE